MADEIKQVLGFDVAQALNALKQLDTGFAAFGAQLQSIGASFTTFNSGGQSTVNTLKAMATSASSAATAFARLAAAKGSGAATGGGGGSATQATGQQAAAAMNTLLGQTAASSAAVSNSLKNVGRSATTSLGEAAKVTSTFTVSFETLVRVVTTQALVRALSAFRNAVESSFASNLAFVKSLSEIQTIDAGSTIQQLGAEVRQLSDSFNIPLLDVAKAKYEILSNGFTTAADQANVFAAATIFGKTAIATEAESVDLITGALNAFGASSDEAMHFAAAFFKTVDLGKVVGSELARSLGRVAPVAAEVGVAAEEIDAAFSTITIGGVSASEAATQIRASLTALIKPSEAMKKAFQELGVANAQELIGAKGLQGAYVALRGTTDGTINQLAELVRNTRALNAVTRLTGTGLDTFKRHLQEISSISNADLTKTFALRRDTNAEKTANDLNKIKNFFTTEFGSELVSAFRGVSDSVGGIDNVIDAFRAMIPVIEVATVAAGTLAAALAFNTIKNGFANFGLTTLLPSIQSGIQAFTGLGAAATSAGQSGFISLTSLQTSAAGYTASANAAVIATNALALATKFAFAALAAFAVGSFIGDKIGQSLDDAAKKAIDTQNGIREIQRTDQERAATDQNNSNQELLKNFNSFVADERKLFFDRVNNAKEANNELLSNTKSTLNKIIAIREGYANDLKKTSKDAEKAVADSQSRQVDTQAKLADTQFEFRTKQFKSVQQAFQFQRKAAELAAQGAKQLASANTPAQEKLAQSTFGRAEHFAQQAKAIADQNKNLSLQFSAERSIENVLKLKIDAEQKFQALQQKNAQLAAKAAADESKRVTKLKELAAIILKSNNLFNKQGQPLSDKTRQQHLQKGQNALDEFFKLSTSKGKLDVSTLLSFDTLKQRFAAGVSGAEIKQLKASSAALTALNAQIQGAIKPVEVAVKFGIDPNAVKNLPALAGFQKLSELVQSNVTKAQTNAVAQRAIADSESVIKGAQAAVDASLKAAKDSTISSLSKSFIADHNPNSDFAAETAAVAEFGQRLKTAAADANLTRAAVVNLAIQGKSLASILPSAFNIDLTGLANALVQVKNIVLEREKLNALKASNPEAAGNAGNSAAQQFLDDLSQKMPAVQSSAAQLSSDSETTASAMAGQVGTSAAVLSNLQQQAIAAERVAAAMAASAGGGGGAVSAEAFGGLIQGFAKGGFVSKYFAGGGFVPRGTDTIPAMLSPNEFVMNAKSTRQFFSQLQQMNAGIEPTFRAHGGGVTNNNSVSVGDIIVQGASQPHQTAREIMNAIKREQRRGTATL